MTDLRTPPSRTLPPDFAEEDEVDLGRYWRPIAARWWLLLAGVVVGLILGYLVSLSSGSVWQAKALLYTGTPLAAGGTNPVQSPQTNSQSVNQIVHSEAAITAAAARCGIHPGQIRGGISTKAVSGGKGAAKATGGGQFYQVEVQGGGPRKSACPANVLAQRVVTDLAPYVATIMQGLQTKLKSDTTTIASIDNQIRIYRSEVNNSNLSDVDRLILSNQLNNLQLQRAQVVNDQVSTQQQIAQARYIQQPKIIERAAASKTTARSPRDSMLVGAIIGLLVGLILALVWDRLPTGALRRNG
jgi:Chain length determinant protein